VFMYLRESYPAGGMHLATMSYRRSARGNRVSHTSQRELIISYELHADLVRGNTAPAIRLANRSASYLDPGRSATQQRRDSASARAGAMSSAR